MKLFTDLTVLSLEQATVLPYLTYRLAAEGMNVSGVMLEGKAAETIVDYATTKGVDLIVMSTHGRSGPSRWAFGSVADRVVRTSPVPVLMAVPRGCRAEPH